MSQKYALVIGNNQYDDPKWHDLKTPERDAEAMANILKDPRIGGFELLDQQALLNASVQEMRVAIEKLFAPYSRKPDDLLLLYFSGHGELDSTNSLYFVARDTQHGNLFSTGLEASYITTLMDRTRSRRQVIILDCCYSGSFGNLPKGGVPTQEIFEGDSEAIFKRDKAIIEDIGNGYGRHILAATEALQLAWEGDTLQGEVENSFFTQFLVEGLAKGLADRDNDGLIDINELYVHIREGMGKSKQTPIIKSPYAEGKLFIARSPVSPFERKQEQLTDLLVQAEKAMNRGDYGRAERLLNNVIQAEADGLPAETAQAMLDELKIERDRMQAYHYIKSLLTKGASRAVQTAWQRFSARYPDYDPDDLAAQLKTPSPQPSPSGRGSKTSPPLGGIEGGPALSAVEGGIAAGLPAPFAWVKISAGQVTIENQLFKVEPFAIAKYPLTNAQFAPFIEAVGYREKKWWTEAGWEAREQGWDWDSKESKWKPTGKPWTEPRYWNDAKWNGAQHPVVGISWYEAVAYCLWLSEKTGRPIMLPTEAQWQYAAQGDDGREYPWGNEWDCQRCNSSVKPCDSNSTSLVTQYEGKGDSPFGVVDMAGNVWEWCLTEYESRSNGLDGTNVRVLRGGSWYYFSTGLFRASARVRYDPDARDHYVGFRLALS